MDNLSGVAMKQTGADFYTTILDLFRDMPVGELNYNNLAGELKKLAKVIGRHLGTRQVFVFLKDDDDKLANIFCPHRKMDDPEVTAGNLLISKVMETGEGVVVENASSNKDFSADAYFGQFDIHSSICVPIRVEGSPFGVIYADSRDELGWGNNALGPLELAGLYTGFLVRHIKLRKELADNERLAAAGKATLNLSHSVKNILQMVGGAAEVIDFGLKTNQLDRVKRSWAILQPNMERLRKFMLDMLDYSKERPLELEPCDFNRIIHGAIESLNSQLKEKASKLQIHIDQTIPVIELDSERIHEMALNIILNAIDIVDKANGVVSVETIYLEEQGVVELKVSDNGPGMSEEMQAKIFTPFESGNDKFGTGLGMAIAKQIIDQHHGSIEIHSELGSGSTFRVILPAKIAD